MKRVLSFCLVVMLAFMLTACGSTSQSQVNTDSSQDTTAEQSSSTNTGKRVLVAYFSRTGNTRTIAGYIADATGADTYEITAANPYTDADIDYNSSSCRAETEQNDKSVRPEIGGQAADIQNYDVIYIGYPIWYGQAPRIISTFLESSDFSGKTIIPFCTSASSDIGSSATDLQSLCSDSAKWIDGKRFSADSSVDTVSSWAKEQLNNA